MRLLVEGVHAISVQDELQHRSLTVQQESRHSFRS